jgi:hypothetical protein
MMSVFAVFLVLTLNSEIYGQSAKEIGSSSPRAQSETRSNTYAPIGTTGYQVLIPEIKMHQIGGNSKPKPTVEVPPEPKRPESVSYESVKKGKRSAGIPRLGFDFVELELFRFF